MITFVPLTFLRDLREECLAHSEKRMPKWKFRLAPDLVMQLQPKPMYLPTPRQIESGIKIRLLQFDGVAIQVGTGTASASCSTTCIVAPVDPGGGGHSKSSPTMKTNGITSPAIGGAPAAAAALFRLLMNASQSPSHTVFSPIWYRMRCSAVMA
jgi:hypothetical protein